MNKPRKNNKGMALIMAIIVVTMVSALLTAYVAMTISERKRAEHEMATGSAEYIARAGLEQAFIDLSCEYDKDKSWADGTGGAANGTVANSNNKINRVAAAVPSPSSAGTDPDDPSDIRSDYQDFYVDVDFPDAANSVGKYTVKIAFGKTVASANTFVPGRLWVRSTGKVYNSDGSIKDQVTLTQLARIKSLALVKVIPATRAFVEIERLHDTLDSPLESPSAVDNLTAATNDHEIRISAETLTWENVTIGQGVTIKGGYSYNFTDASRNTGLNRSIITGSVTISGAGTSTMGGVGIQ
ncbi:MAG: hypothetical protein Q8L26_05495 [Candidatus Omnitrophota bacterium]|nr:hypothetical protein [Candidatus Omnitrophota bacterium]